jgi:hypothetical protein
MDLRLLRKFIVYGVVQLKLKDILLIFLYISYFKICWNLST